MKNFKVGINLFRPHIVILLFLLFGIIISLVNLLNVRKQMETLYNEVYLVNNAVYSINAAFERMQKSIFRAAVNNSQDVTNEEITNVRNDTVILEEQIALLKQHYLGDLDVVTRLEEKLAELIPMRDNALNLAFLNCNVESVTYMENNNVLVINETQRELESLIHSMDAKEHEIIVSLQTAQRNTVVWLICLGIVSMLFSIGVGIYHKQSQKKA